MRPIDQLFVALGKSAFRRRFHLSAADRDYVTKKTMPVVLGHARDFVARRLAPAEPANDGKQTPLRGHPVFVAQHATATCCRGCLAKWHAVPAGRELSPAEREHVVAVIGRWIEREMG